MQSIDKILRLCASNSRRVELRRCWVVGIVPSTVDWGGGRSSVDERPPWRKSVCKIPDTGSTACRPCLVYPLLQPAGGRPSLHHHILGNTAADLIDDYPAREPRVGQRGLHILENIRILPLEEYVCSRIHQIWPTSQIVLEVDEEGVSRDVTRATPVEPTLAGGSGARRQD